MVSQEKVLKRLKEIERKIKNSKLIDKLIGVTKEHGNYWEKEHDCYTEVRGNYNEDSLKIKYASGYSMMGGGDLHVSYMGKEVFAAIDGDRKGFEPHVGKYRIERYLPGEWEKKVSYLSRKKKKLEIEKKPEIPAKELANLCKAFNIK